MSKNKLTKSEFSRLAGVNPSTTTRLCKTSLQAAWDGKRIDANHPDAASYVALKHSKATEPAATGLDPLYQEATDYCAESGRYSISGLQRKFRIGYDRAKTIIETMKAAGLIHQDYDPQILIPEPPEPPKLRGNAAANQNKKNLALEEYNAKAKAGISDPARHEVPEDMSAFADMTIRELIEMHGTDTAFLEWLKACKEIEIISEKRLKNAQTKSELIGRTLVQNHVIDTFNSAHLRLMKDGSKSIAAGVVSKSKGGATLPEIEAFVSDIVGSFIKPIKNKITRVLKGA